MKNRFRGIPRSLIQCIVFVVVGCSDPGPVQSVDSEFSVVISDLTTRWVYELRLRDLSVDSFQLAEQPLQKPVASGRSRRLFVPFADSVAVVNLGASTGSGIWPAPAEAGISVSGDERYLAVFGFQLVVLRLSDGKIVFQDTTNVLRGSFSPDERFLYAVWPHGSGGRSVRQIDLADSSVADLGLLPNGGLPQIVASREVGRFYIYQSVGAYTYVFTHYDVMHDSALYTRQLQPGEGTMVVTPDEEFVFYTSPGSIISNGNAAPPWPFVGVYDCAGHYAVTDISTSGIYDSTGQTIDEAMKSLQMTADGRWLTGLSLLGDHLIKISSPALAVEIRTGLGKPHTSNSLTTHPSAR